MSDLCVPVDEFPQEVFDVLQDGQKMTSDLQDDEVEGTYDSDVYYTGYNIYNCMHVHSL